MRLALTRGDRRLVLFGGIIVLLLLVVAFVLAAGTGDRGEVTTTYSSASGGAKAAYLLLDSLGYHVERWEDPPSELREPETTTFILAEPLELPSDDDREAIHRFLDQGGRVIATGPAAALFLDGTAMVNPLGAPTWSQLSAIAPSAMSQAAPQITMAKRAYWLTPGSPALQLYGEPGSPSVIGLGVGRGEAMWWAAATPLSNAGIQQPGNLEFFLASIGPREGRRVVWDEYFHGRRRTLAASIWHSPAKWVGAQLALVAIVVLLTHSRRSGPVIDPPVESRLSPLEFVRTLGSLYRRARATSVPIDVASRRLRYALSLRFGANSRATPDEIADVVSRRSRHDASDLATVLRDAEALRESPSLDATAALAVVRALGEQMQALHHPQPPSKENR